MPSKTLYSATDVVLVIAFLLTILLCFRIEGIFRAKRFQGLHRTPQNPPEPRADDKTDQLQQYSFVTDKEVDYERQVRRELWKDLSSLRWNNGQRRRRKWELVQEIMEGIEEAKQPLVDSFTDESEVGDKSEPKPIVEQPGLHLNNAGHEGESKDTWFPRNALEFLAMLPSCILSIAPLCVFTAFVPNRNRRTNGRSTRERMRDATNGGPRMNSPWEGRNRGGERGEAHEIEDEIEDGLDLVEHPLEPEPTDPQIEDEERKSQIEEWEES